MAVLSPLQTALRSLQAVAAFAALVIVLHGSTTSSDPTPSASLATLLISLATYSTLLWSGFHVLVLGVLGLERTPRGGCQRTIDGFLAAASVISGMLLLLADGFTQCDDCRDIGWAAVLEFAIGLLLLATFVSSCLAAAATAASVLDLATTVTSSATEPDVYMPLNSPAGTPAAGVTEDEMCASDLVELRRGLRFLQFGGAGIALVNVLLGYKRYFDDADVTGSVAFAMLAAYTSVLFSGWHLFIVDICSLAQPLALSTERAAYVTLALLQIAAGFSYALMDPTEGCGSGESSCSTHNAGVAFLFIVAVAYAVDLGFTFTRYQNEKQADLRQLEVNGGAGQPVAPIHVLSSARNGTAAIAV